MYLIGTTSINLMVAISIERYYVIYRPMNLKSIKKSTSMKGIILSIILAFLWAIFPLLGNIL
jgi:hypothetical protein